MFKGKKGQALAADIGKRSKTFVPGEKLPEKKPDGPTKEDIAAIKVGSSSIDLPSGIKLNKILLLLRLVLARLISLQGSN